MNNVGRYSDGSLIIRPTVGFWRLGSGPCQLAAHSKPNWFVRMMMRLLLDFHWLDL